MKRLFSRRLLSFFVYVLAAVAFLFCAALSVLFAGDDYAEAAYPLAVTLQCVLSAAAYALVAATALRTSRAEPQYERRLCRNLTVCVTVGIYLTAAAALLYNLCARTVTGHLSFVWTGFIGLPIGLAVAAAVLGFGLVGLFAPRAQHGVKSNAD